MKVKNVAMCRRMLKTIQISLKAATMQLQLDVTQTRKSMSHSKALVANDKIKVT